MKNHIKSVLKASIVLAAVVLTLTVNTVVAYAASYSIVPGDTLYTVGRLFGTSADTLKSNNSLSSDMIYPGQIIDVPASIYTVKSGDTLFLIAKNNGITLSALQKANNKWDSLLYPGQKLLLPAGAQTSVSAPHQTVISYTSKEVDLLARLITAEARGESYEAMVAVGAVVVNRVQSPQWPSGISDVIYHVTGGYHQFTPVKNGEINIAPTDLAIKAAWAALYDSDPSKGALFFFDNTSTNQWLWSKPITARIGNMVFAR